MIVNSKIFIGNIINFDRNKFFWVVKFIDFIDILSSINNNIINIIIIRIAGLNEILNFLFEAILVMYIKRINIPPIMIKNKI